MSLTAKLQFGDNGFRRYAREYLVTSYQSHVARRHNEARPDGSPQCDYLELSVVAPGREDLNLYEWYVDRSPVSGRILIELSAPAQNQAPQWKEVLFENGVCFSLGEEYHIDTLSRRTLHLKVAVEQMTVNNVVFNGKRA